MCIEAFGLLADWRRENMPFGKYIIIPIFIAFQAFTMMLLQRYIPGTHEALAKGGPGLITWISFQAWAMYFLAGCTPKMGLKTLVGYLGGIIASVVIFELNGALNNLNSVDGGHLWGLYLAVFVVVIFVISAEKVPGLDFVPSYFLGAGVFFALMTYVPKPAEITSKWSWYGLAATTEMVACAVGLVYGWWTVTFKTWYVAKVGAEEKAPAAVEADVASA
jgi:hypothetical protein